MQRPHASATALPEIAAPALELEPGSFRDRGARVFYRDGEVLRGLDAAAYGEWQRVCGSGLPARWMGDGRMVATEELEETLEPWSAVLRHEPIRFISYPYEWCFDMLRDAARLQLELLTEALDADCTLQDASPFNVQWRGTRPLLIDVTSLKPLAAGEPWIGYRQFCQLFLYPLLLQAYRGLPFQPWLRGSLDGISPEDCWRLMSARDLFRRGVLTHVYLHARAQTGMAASTRSVRAELRSAGFAKAVIQGNLRGLRRVIDGLRWAPNETAWSQYASQTPYAARDEAAKHDFVAGVAAARRRSLVWDLGANTGTYSRLAAEWADAVIAMDADQLAVARLYRALRADGVDNVLPLVVDLMNPSPNLGWRGLERKTLAQRGRPQLTLCLALLHHVVIGGNVPLPQAIAWLAELGGELVVEFVDRGDPMVQGLLRNRVDQFTDYDLATFDACLRRHYSVLRSETLCDGNRRLYHAAPLR